MMTEDMTTKDTPTAPITLPVAPTRTPVRIGLPGLPAPVLTDTVYVSFSAEINPNTAESLIAALTNLVNQRVPHIYLLLSTPGGSVMHGLTIYNTIRALPCDMTIHNVGNVDSIGNAIILGGSRRYACQHSTFMFHGVGFDNAPGVRLEEKFLRERLETLRADQRRIGAILQERTQLPTDQIERMFLDAQTIDAAAAVRLGIVHEVRDVQIPAGGPILSLVFKR